MFNQGGSCDLCRTHKSEGCVIGSWDAAWRKDRFGYDICPECVEAMKAAIEQQEYLAALAGRVLPPRSVFAEPKPPMPSYYFTLDEVMAREG